MKRIFSVFISLGMAACSASISGSKNSGGATAQVGGAVSINPSSGGTPARGGMTSATPRMLERIAISGSRLKVPSAVVDGQIVPLSIGTGELKFFDTKRNQTCSPANVFGGYFCVPPLVPPRNSYADSACKTQPIADLQDDGDESVPLYLESDGANFHLYEPVLYTGDVYAGSLGTCALQPKFSNMRYFKKGAELTASDFVSMTRLSIPLNTPSDPNNEIAAFVFEGADGSRALHPTIGLTRANFYGSVVSDSQKSYFTPVSVNFFAEDNCTTPYINGSTGDFVVTGGITAPGYTSTSPLKAFRTVGTRAMVSSKGYAGLFGECVKQAITVSNYATEPMPLEEVPALVRHRATGSGVGLDSVEGNNIIIPTFVVRDGVPCKAYQRQPHSGMAWYCGRGNSMFDTAVFRDDKCTKPIAAAILIYKESLATWKVGDLIHSKTIDVNNVLTVKQFRVAEFAPVFSTTACEPLYPQFDNAIVGEIEPIPVVMQ